MVNKCQTFLKWKWLILPLTLFKNEVHCVYLIMVLICGRVLIFINLICCLSKNILKTFLLFLSFSLINLICYSHVISKLKTIQLMITNQKGQQLQSALIEFMSFPVQRQFSYYSLYPVFKDMKY